MTAEKKAELLACPCCGGEAVAVGGDIPTSKQITIKCDGPQKSGLRGCGIQIMGRRLRLSHSELLAALTERWNTRAPSPPASAEVVQKAMAAYDAVVAEMTENGWSFGNARAIAKAMSAALQAAGVSGVPNWSQMARAMQRIGACGTEEEIESLLCNAAAPER